MSEGSIKVKLLLIGPVKVGKTTIANFLAGINKSVTEEYHPTAGVRYFNIVYCVYTLERILEFEKDVQIPGKPSWQGGNQRLDIELWDCSGDRKYL
jgi:Rab-like protein 5